MILHRLKQEILESGLKQNYIARQVGLDPTTFSKKLHGYISMTEDEKLLVSLVLRKSVEDIFYLEDLE